jgi:radical SAM protein with 4Fe4S-binding SPASM domain
MDDLALRNGESSTRVIDNRGGHAGRPVGVPLAKTCTMPFRQGVVTWQGNLILCCMDWRQEFVAGNVNKRPLPVLWRGKKMEAARAFLQNKMRDFRPCKTCDRNSGPRAGLLPKYPPPTAEQARLVLNA